MIKKCIGCGFLLQDTDKEKIGYTPNIKNEYCMRCFRLKNYGEKKEEEKIDEERIIKKVNKSKGIVFFLIDYLNLNKYTLEIFKKINLPKILIVSKSDILRRDMKFSKIKAWLRKVYNVNDDIAFISSKNNFKNINIFKYMDKMNVNTCFIMGITNAGKSTFINGLLKNRGIDKEIVASNKPNTTLDFIKLKIDNYVIFDTPGFNYPNASSKVIKREIKPITYNLKENTTLVINEKYKIYFNYATSVTLYLNDYSLVKRTFVQVEGKQVKVNNNEDLVILGLGFINIKKSGLITISDDNFIEFRSSVSGEEYE